MKILPLTDRKAILTLCFTVSVILCLLFREVIWYPNDFLFSASFDGIKNYYTFIYYVLYDTGFHFSGMGYPFGEHIVYTDNQPFFAVILGFINNQVWDISDNLIGIFNYIILLSFLLGALIFYKILRKCLLPPWYSIITAIFIVFFAQQNNMMGPYAYAGAYALSYTWVIPLQWYILIKIFEQEGLIKWLALHVLFNITTGLIHPYYLLFNFLLSVFVLFFNVRLTKSRLKFLLPVAIAAVLPILAIRGFLYLTDYIQDRPVTPIGLSNFRGNLAEVFYPPEAVFATYWQNLFNLNKSTYDGYGYIGVAGIIVCFLTLIKAFNYLFRGKLKRIIYPVLPFPLRLAIWPAIAILLFSFGFPFRLGLAKLYDLVPVLRQFRFLVRVLWIFYYIFSVYAAFYLYQLYLYLRIKINVKFAVSFIFLFLISWALDALVNVLDMTQLIRQNRLAKDFRGENFNYRNALLVNGYKVDDFQAILPFPYFAEGSEKIFFISVNPMPYAMGASVQTGLPLINSFMSRTSLQQALKGIQLLSNDYIKKDLLEFLPSEKPLLLVVVKDSLKIYEQNLIAKAKIISQHEKVDLYLLPLKAFKASAKIRAYEAFKDSSRSLIQEGNIYKSKPVANTVISTFSENESQKYLFEKGALTAEKGPLVIYDYNIPNAQEEKQEYEFSVWIDLSTKFPPENISYFQSDQNGSVVDANNVRISQEVNIYKEWVNVQFKFTLQKPQNKVKVIISGADLVVDELLIRPSDLNMYKVTSDNRIIYNNFLIH